METPEINLTKAVDAVARELWIARASLTTKGTDELAALAAADMWDENGVPANLRYYQKRLALAALTPETVADIARQVFDAVLEADELIAEQVPDNPWAQSWDEAAKDL